MFLRNEWGFQGYVVTDYDQGNCANDDVAVNRMVRAGNDQHMLDMTLPRALILLLTRQRALLLCARLSRTRCLLLPTLHRWTALHRVLRFTTLWHRGA